MSNKEYLGRADWLFICQLISGEISKYVKKVEGKDLSTNDLTDALVAKINSVDNLAPLNSPALTGVPTAPTASAGTNTTQIATTAFTTTAITNAVKDITGIKFVKVASFDALPAIGANGTIYLVPKTTALTNNVYTEYYWDGNATTGKYEMLGDTSVDLSNYLTKDEVTELATTEVQSVWDSVFGS